jgi:UDP-glucose 4-epimerase
MIALWGANGFIGRHLVQKLHDMNYEIKLFSRGYSQFPPNIPDLGKISADFSKSESYIEYLRDCDTIVLMVSASGAKTFINNPDAELRQNVIPYKDFFLSLEHHNIKPENVIYLSSGGAIYGITDHNQISEERPLNPVTPYGQGKMEIENLLRNYSARTGAKHTILRVSNPVGLWGKGLIPAALAAIKSGTPLAIEGDGSTVRDYFDVRDLAKAIANVIKKRGRENMTLNVGSGQGHNINQVIDIIEKITGKQVPAIHIKPPAGEIDYNVLDCRKIYNYTGWAAQTTLEQSIREIWNNQ